MTPCCHPTGSYQADSRAGSLARTPIQYFETDVTALARKLDQLATMSDHELWRWRQEALERAGAFRPAVLRPQYEAVMSGQPR
jgi:hypothetical protein